MDRNITFLLTFVFSHLFPLGPPPASPPEPVEPTESTPPEPGTPATCDPALSFDAISTLRGEILFFKDRSDQKTLFSYIFFWYTMLRKENRQTLDRDFLNIQNQKFCSKLEVILMLHFPHFPKTVKIIFKDLGWFDLYPVIIIPKCFKSQLLFKSRQQNFRIRILSLFPWKRTPGWYYI